MMHGQKNITSLVS